MNCQPCREGADIYSAAQARTDLSEDQIALAAIAAKAKHKKCAHPATCTCQHRVGRKNTP